LWFRPRLLTGMAWLGLGTAASQGLFFVAFLFLRTVGFTGAWEGGWSGLVWSGLGFGFFGGIWDCLPDGWRLRFVIRGDTYLLGS
jgi:hypothetical protein